jgi:hypothetical protein
LSRRRQNRPARHLGVSENRLIMITAAEALLAR